MKLICFIILFPFCLPTAAGIPFLAGTAIHSDGLLVIAAAEPVNGMTISLETGPGWERDADFRIDDMMIRNVYTLSCFRISLFDLAVMAAFEYRRITAGTTVFNVPGFSTGAGIEIEGTFLRCRLSGGIQILSAEVQKSYEGTTARSMFIDTWKAPLFWASIGILYTF
ncbi:MAG: hypothetical protein JXB03_10770 [Spirochaetales bacterium]|nr:hypothetical protein [Spirochaetales bacterium]